jgi:sarcosine oxidase, subunit gamma
MHEVLELRGIIRVQTWDSEAVAPPAIEGTLGTAWPRKVGLVASGYVDILCTGPTDWWLFAAHPDVAAILEQLKTACMGSAFRVTDLSHAFGRIAVEGRESRMLLAKGCALDLHPARLPPEYCARTRLAGMPVIIRCVQESTFQCIVASSYRHYLLSWLTDAAVEFSSVAHMDRNTHQR